MDDKQELSRRRKAIRLWLRGVNPGVILQDVNRSHAWLYKWISRFQRFGAAGLKSQPRRPLQPARRYSTRTVTLIVRIRLRLVKRTVGLIGPRVIRRELRQSLSPGELPSLSTIKRVLRAKKLTRLAPDGTPAFFPAPTTAVEGSLHALDWTCRYLEDGPKVYAFHTLALRTRACVQTIARDKGSRTVIAHALEAWKTMGIPEFLQLDNDAAFCGGYRVPRVFGQFVRLCLYVGIELIFLPVAEPERNGGVERLNGLWGQSFWERQRFGSAAAVTRASPGFIAWYMNEYEPPALQGLTPAQAHRRETHCRWTGQQATRLPGKLPITAGRVHFIRKVSADGSISLLNETWKVGKRLAHKYVWATITTHCRQLAIWCQRSAQPPWKLIHSFDYEIQETVARLRPEFKRDQKP